MSVAWVQELDRQIERFTGEMVALRRHLHSHPEPSGGEWHTTAHLQSFFQGRGLTVRLGPCGRGLVVDHPAFPPSEPRIALRADIDALMIQDAKSVEYCSQVPGMMHACGHDAHTAILAGTLCALWEAERQGRLPWPVCWRGIFQPAEETNQGAREMVGGGALDGVQAILALHVDPSLALGKIGVRMGAFTASCDEMDVTIAGRGGHAARPHESIDPIATAAQLISSIYLFVPRATDSRDPVVVTIGQISGGANPNVIPEEVRLRGTIRTLNASIRERTKDHIRQLARGLAEASGAKIQIEFTPGPDSVQNDHRLTALIRGIGAELLGSENVEEIARPSMGGEDFAHYLQHVPGCMFRLGVHSSEKGGSALHTPSFDIDERALTIGAKIFARATVTWCDSERQPQRGA